MNPFLYCRTPHDRKHSPAGYSDYSNFKPWLRDEFSFRCVYCLYREAWTQDGSDSFGIDHVVPKGRDPTQESEYRNLVYCCRRCNTFKGGQDLELQLDQLALGELFQVDKEGCIAPKNGNPFGEFLIRALQLDHPKQNQARRRIFRILEQLKHHHHLEARHLVNELLGFPRDIPDLAKLAPPNGNMKHGSEQQSCFARKARKQLPSTYFCCGQ